MKRRTLISGIGLVALTEAVSRASAAWIPANIGNGVSAQDDNFKLALSSGADDPGTTDVPPSDEGMIEANAFRLDLLPFLRSGAQTHQFCSYDRAGDNYDAEYLALYTEKNGECVIFDAMGPGCLSRH